MEHNMREGISKQSDNGPQAGEVSKTFSWEGFTDEQLRNSPSFQRGMAAEHEKRDRTKAVKYILKLGKKLQLRPYVEIATAIVFFNRFFTRQALQDHKKYAVALTCVFLAAKVESNVLKDTRIKTLIKWDFEITKQKQPFSTEYEWKKKDELWCYERILMMTLSFDLKVQHPHKIVLTQVKSIKEDFRDCKPEYFKRLAQDAWNFLNDSLKLTNLCLQYTATKIGAATIFLAVLYQKRRKDVNEQTLLEIFQKGNISKKDIYEISKKMMAAYPDTMKEKLLQLKRVVLALQDPDNGRMAKSTQPSPATMPSKTPTETVSAEST